MAYHPSFDVSTVYYADRALRWLSGLEGDAAPLLALLRDLDVWTREKPNDDYFQLNRAVAKIAGMATVGERGFLLESRDYDAGSRLLRLLFGVLCLGHVTEALVLGQRVHYIPGAAGSSLPFHRVAPLLAYFDRRHGVWEQFDVDAARQITNDFAAAPLRDPLQKAFIHEMATASLSVPFLELAAHLYDTSAGMIAPMVSETYPLLGGSNPGAYIETLDRRTRKTPLLATTDKINLLGRMVAYVTNAVWYDRAARLMDQDYVLNPIRGPFLAALYVTNLGDRKRFIDALSRLVGLSADDVRGGELWPPTAIAEKDVTQSTLILALVLAQARDALDILPATYRLRRALRALREHIESKGFDAALSTALEEFYDRASIARMVQRGAEIRVRVISLPVRPPNWLYRPRYVGSRRFLNSCQIVTDAYRGVYSLAERLEFIAKEARSHRAEPARQRALEAIYRGTGA